MWVKKFWVRSNKPAKKEKAMSNIKFDCPECRGGLEVDESAAGRLVNCPQCQKQIRIPSAPPAPPVAIPVPATQSPPVTQEQKACPFCGEMILAVAKKCKHCDEFLEKKDDVEGVTFTQPLAAVNIQYPRVSQAAPPPMGPNSTLTMPTAGINVAPSPQPIQAQANLVYPRQPPRSPGWMVFASLIIMGLGQGLLGQKAKGWTIFFSTIVLYNILAAVLYDSLGVHVGRFVAWTVLVVPVSIDAFKVAKRLRNGRPVGRWDFFPNSN